MKSLPKILVTGANGLIGRYVIDKLLANNFHVIALYNMSQPEVKHGNITFIKADLCKYTIDENIKPLFAIIHCAAIIPSQQHSDEMCYQSNRQMDETVFDFCKKSPQTKIIYMSGVYINDYSENDLLQKSKYLSGKLESEKRFSILNNPFLSFRISSPYGVYQKNNNVLKIFIDNAIQTKPLLLHGSGKRTQDFIFADDIAEAVLLSLNEDVPSTVLNICSGKPVSMQQLAAIVQENKPEVKIECSGIDDPQEHYQAEFDNSNAKLILNWYPKTSIEIGIRTMFNYLLK